MTKEPHLRAWKSRGTDRLGSYAEAQGGQGGDSRQEAQLHQGQVLPDQPSGLEWWSSLHQ